MTSPDSPHRRLNALTGDWILVSPQRTKRPWLGKQAATSSTARTAHDPKCYLCAGNERAGGLHNPDYESTFVFDNDFAAILPERGPGSAGENELLQTEPVSGVCRVICFSPRHDLTLPEMLREAIRKVIEVWAAQTAELGQIHRWVQVFENKGDIMGCSKPPSARSDLGERFDPQRAGQGGRPAARLLAKTWPAIARRLPRSGVAKRRARRGRECGLGRGRSVLGDLAL